MIGYNSTKLRYMSNCGKIELTYFISSYTKVIYWTRVDLQNKMCVLTKEVTSIYACVLKKCFLFEILDSIWLKIIWKSNRQWKIKSCFDIAEYLFQASVAKIECNMGTCIWYVSNKCCCKWQIQYVYMCFKLVFVIQLRILSFW